MRRNDRVRSFVAAELSDEAHEGVWQCERSLHRKMGREMKWVEKANLHVTLRFLGEVEAEGEAGVVRAIESAVAGTKQFVLPVAGFGAFPSARRARVVWVGCEAVPALELVQNRVEEQMSEIGFPVEGRPFRPHLTLGRVKRGARLDRKLHVDFRLPDVQRRSASC